MGINRRLRRPALTLMELLVTISITLLILSLAYLAMPNLQSRRMVDAADRLTGWLLIAKQTAKSSGLATGVRLVVSPGGYCTTLQYVQEQADYSPVGVVPPDPTKQRCMCDGPAPIGVKTVTGQANDPNGVATVTFSSNISGTVPPGPTTPAMSPAVQVGDYIQFGNGGPVYPIASAPVLNTTNYPSPGNWQVKISIPQSPYNVPADTGTIAFTIIRQPRPMLGENDLVLPEDTAIIMASSGNNPIASSNIPQRSGGTIFEVLFSPSGNVIGQGTGADKIYLLLDDITAPPHAAAPVVVAVNVRTGQIGSFPVDTSGSDPFSFAKTGRSSGM